MVLTDHQKKQLRRLGHALHPLVLVGRQGLTANVAAELGRALEAHELVKVRARAGKRESRDAVFAGLERATAAVMVARIGNVALYYKKNSKLDKILLPDS